MALVARYPSSLSVLVAEDVRQKIDALAAEQGWSVGEAARHFLALGIAVQEEGARVDS